MAGDLAFWLEAGSGCDVPPECFAAVRQGDARGPAPPTYCVPHKVSCLGRVDPRGGPIVVDVFQRVGSISLESVEAGMLVEKALDWPGRAAVRLRVAVVAQGTEVPVLAQLPQVFGEPEEPPPPAVAAQPVLEMPLSKPICPASPPLAPRVSEQAPPEKSEKLYTPMSLNNCNQIIPNLYLGGVQSVEDHGRLLEQGIRAVCCCCRELEYPTSDFCKDLEYYRVDVEDMAREPIEVFFPEATEFIHSWVSREQPVLVHCRAGVSRSASVVIAYLIAYQGYSLYDAFFLVRSHRPVVTPNIGFMEKLSGFEEAQRDSEPTIEMMKYECWYTSSERAAVPDLKPE